MDDYPPEFDGPDYCPTCGLNVSHSTTECECPECPVCSEVDDLACYSNGHMKKGNRAFNLEDLASHLGANGPEGISKRLFKDTECGIAFYEVPGRVTIAGYAEGTGDASCTPIEFKFPIELAEFDAGVIRADLEGCELYDEFHCPQCGAEVDYEESCEDCGRQGTTQ